jgi:SAM-dependent methyltransferase
MESKQYVIRGGIADRERLRILARVMRPTTLGLFEEAGVRPGMACLDAGCGGGDVSFDLARLVGPEGRVVGLDMDAVKLALAQREAEEQQLRSVDFRKADITTCRAEPAFDLVYARFLLTHLSDPAAAVATMRQFLRPGGILVVEDIDYTGYFCYPDCAAVWRFVELYSQSVRRRGADPNIGPRLPVLLSEAGLERVRMNVVQPAGLSGEAKLINPLTMEAIGETVVGDGAASPAEVEQLVAEMHDFARDPRTVVSMARVVQAWGCRA